MYSDILDSINSAASDADTNIQVLVNYCKQHNISACSNSAVAALKHAAAWGYEAGYQDAQGDAAIGYTHPASQY